MALEPNPSSAPITTDPDLLHRANLFQSALNGPGRNVHALGNAVQWLGELGPRAGSAIPLLLPLMNSENPPFGAWFIKAVAARALARIDPAQFVEPALKVLVALAASPDSHRHHAGSLVLGWMAPLSAEGYAMLKGSAEQEGADPVFAQWFKRQEHTLRPGR